MRDYAAEMYRAQSGWSWSPSRGSKSCPARALQALSATQVAVQGLSARPRSCRVRALSAHGTDRGRAGPCRLARLATDLGTSRPDPRAHPAYDVGDHRPAQGIRRHRRGMGGGPSGSAGRLHPARSRAQSALCRWSNCNRSKPCWAKGPASRPISIRRCGRRAFRSRPSARWTRPPQQLSGVPRPVGVTGAVDCSPDETSSGGRRGSDRPHFHGSCSWPFQSVIAAISIRRCEQRRMEILPCSNVSMLPVVNHVT